MKKRLGIYRISALTVGFISLILANFRAMILIENIDLESADAGIGQYGYFINKNVETIAFVVAVIAFAILFTIIALFVGRKSKLSTESPDEAIIVFVSALCGFMNLTVGIYYVFAFIFQNSISTEQFVISIMMAASSVGFLYLALTKNPDKKCLTPIAKLIPAIYVLVRLVISFIEQNQKPLNSSIAFHLLGLAFLLVFLLYDGRIQFGGVSLGIYLFFGYIATLLLLLFTIPNVYITVFKVPYLDNCNLFSASDTVLAIYCLIKTYSVSLPGREFASEESSEKEISR